MTSEISTRRYKQVIELDITALSSEGRGIGRMDGKTVFVSGALPGERVEAGIVKQRRNYNEAIALQILAPSPDRVDPECSVFGQCGGCVLQHLDPRQQIHYKQQQVQETLSKMAQLEDVPFTPALTDEVWHYRRKARLGVRNVRKKSRVLVGFRELNSNFITDTQRCHVLHESVGDRIEVLQALIMTLSVYNKIAQIEVAVAENATALVFRHLEALSEQDKRVLTDFAVEHEIAVYLQPAGPDSIHLLHPEQLELVYSHPAFAVTIPFHVSDFTQIHFGINRKMVQQAADWLELNDDDELLDLFCGIGNFTLPLATRVKNITGVELSLAMVEKAKANAQRNSLSNTEFYATDLMQECIEASWVGQKYNKLLLDPPRSGAQHVINALAKKRFDRIVYVSCHPASFARDAGILVNEQGYRLEQACVMDMFPHTGHIETMGLFVK